MRIKVKPALLYYNINLLKLQLIFASAITTTCQLEEKLYLCTIHVLLFFWESTDVIMIFSHNFFEKKNIGTGPNYYYLYFYLKICYL